jgi:hypothetical protein
MCLSRFRLTHITSQQINNTSVKEIAVPAMLPAQSISHSHCHLYGGRGEFSATARPSTPLEYMLALTVEVALN